MKSSEFTLQINDSSSHLRTSSICHVIVVEVITLLMLVVSSRQNVVFARRLELKYAGNLILETEYSLVIIVEKLFGLQLLLSKSQARVHIC
jgi:hypothetical protein